MKRRRHTPGAKEGAEKGYFFAGYGEEDEVV
jgi:hypothetical protein